MENAIKLMITLETPKLTLMFKLKLSNKYKQEFTKKRKVVE